MNLSKLILVTTSNTIPGERKNIMVQGIIGGGTSYEEQSIKDIFEDINNWEIYANKLILDIDSRKMYLVECGFWDVIPYNFQMTVVSSRRCLNTFIEDFKIIKKAFIADFITRKEVNLLNKIGEKSVNFNNEFGRTYKEDDYWKDYGNSDFRVVEEIYGNGRDFFVTLQDAVNAANRLEDYMDHNSIQNNINVSGNGNNMNVQQGNHNMMNITPAHFSELEIMIIDLLDDLSNYVSTNNKEDAEEYLELIKEEAVKNKPRKNTLEFAVNGLKAIKGTVEFSAAVTAIIQLVSSL